MEMVSVFDLPINSPQIKRMMTISYVSDAQVIRATQALELYSRSPAALSGPVILQQLYRC
ncbi:hypothetical protein CUMW_057410 [Citrus unshiu]|nr:hypothetical protein CUMW_057410 [Citrus unshiu]